MRQPFPTLLTWEPPTLAAFGLGTALGASLVGMLMVGEMTPDSSAQVGRWPSPIEFAWFLTSLAGPGLSILGLAGSAAGATAVRRRPALLIAT